MPANGGFLAFVRRFLVGYYRYVGRIGSGTGSRYPYLDVFYESTIDLLDSPECTLVPEEEIG